MDRSINRATVSIIAVQIEWDSQGAGLIPLRFWIVIRPSQNQVHR